MFTNLANYGAPPCIYHQTNNPALGSIGYPRLRTPPYEKNRGLKQVVGLRERNQYQTKGAKGTHEKKLHRNNFQHFLV